MNKIGQGVNSKLLLFNVGYLVVTFKIFDLDRDGLLCEDEIRTMVKSMIQLKSENIPHSAMASI